ncbi:hypothetical protein [Burkholderia gladioli]|uniref:hypothetical protein n=1 Tax=Burkholderia gladioli TaxID=28095 RepID=UPI001364C459|nr:hypothetical protein [Burkholderia gladioli]
MRADNSLFDSMIVGAVLKGPGGLLEDQSGKKKTSKDLYRLTTFRLSTGKMNFITQLAI